MLAHQPQHTFDPVSIAPPQLRQHQQKHQQRRPSNNDCLPPRHPQHYYSSDSSNINLDAFNNSDFSFASTPLTPCSSQQYQQQQQQYHQQQQLPLEYTPPSSADASPTNSSPAFSATNSPGDDFAAAAAPAVAIFDPTGFSMPEDVSAVNNSFSTVTSSPPPIKLFHAQDGYGLDQQPDADDGVALLLQNGLSASSENLDYNSTLLSPAKFHHQQQQHSNSNNKQRKHSSASSAAPVPSLESSHSPYSSSSSSSSVGDAQQHQQQQQQQQQETTCATQFPTTPVTAHPLPTPEHTPVQGSFLAPPELNNYGQVSPRDAEASEADMAMRRAILEQQRQQQQRSHSQSQQPQQGTVNGESSFPYSLAAPSVSTLNSNSPATPHTSHADELNGNSRGLPHGEDYPKETTAIDRWMDECLQFDDLADFANNQLGMNRSITDLYQDELYNPTMAAMPQSQPQAAPQDHGGNKGFHSYLVNDRLQAAHQAAAAQSQQNDIRTGSPFRQGSPYQPASAYHSAHLQQPTQMGSEIPQSGLRGMALMPEGQSEPKTISPKHALLDYDDSEQDPNMALFPSQPEAPQYHVSAPSGGLQQPAQNFLPMEQQFHNQYSQPTQHQQQQHHQQQHQRQQQQYYLQQQALQQQIQNQRQQQHHQQQQQQQQQHRQPQQHHQPMQRAPHPSMENNRLVHHTPDFPASLPSMESTNSATNTPTDALSSAQRTAQDVTSSSSPGDIIKRPDGTTSEAGTYSCTYHGCAQRFETPSKLQKHKREAHRQTTPGSHNFVRDTSAGPHGLRNTQAGPHRCERINPQTGKACNSIFSRPYDLTRHEDTIHNARKQKVRCHLCTEEKTFSRNDALTRHMRVVHPEVNWPGKQKRKGRD